MQDTSKIKQEAAKIFPLGTGTEFDEKCSKLMIKDMIAQSQKTITYVRLRERGYSQVSSRLLASVGNWVEKMAEDTKKKEAIKEYLLFPVLFSAIIALSLAYLANRADDKKASQGGIPLKVDCQKVPHKTNADGQKIKS